MQEYLSDIRVSQCYASAPMYRTDQPQFVNAVVSASTQLGPLELLGIIKQIEKRLGRTDRERNGPREIDLDLIAYGLLRYRFVAGEEVLLQVPHPRLAERRFVLLPMFELEPDFGIPGLGTVRTLLARTAGQVDDVHVYEDARLSLRSA